MKRLTTLLAASLIAMNASSPYTVKSDAKIKQPKKVWNKKLKCYTINGEPVERKEKEND